MGSILMGVQGIYELDVDFLLTDVFVEFLGFCHIISDVVKELFFITGLELVMTPYGLYMPRDF